MAMEERFRPPPSTANNYNHQQLPEHRMDDDRVALQIVLPSTNHTYIVQMPKDQIYRVPPPENAAYVERQRQPPHKAPRLCGPCACYTASGFFAAALIAVVFLVIYKFTLSPKNPLFVIQSFSIADHKSGPTHYHAPPTYHVGIQATNPNSFNSLVYVAGTAELVFSGKEVAKGQSPAVSQAAKQIDEFKVALVGTGPTAGKRALKLRLNMSLHMKKKSWLTDHTDLVLVECDFVVDSVPRQKGSAIVKSQTCAYL